MSVIYIIKDHLFYSMSLNLPITLNSKPISLELKAKEKDHKSIRPYTLKELLVAAIIPSVHKEIPS